MTLRWNISGAGLDRPLVAVALHDGHEVREGAMSFLALDDAGRLREEDPFASE